ncbi:MAG: ShlB/FhaC/HecB family hemolysin secretion/activation protein, partial [Hyphococcus sp.]
VFFIPDQPDELILAEMGYQLPIGDAGTNITLSGAVSKFDAGAFLGTLGTESRQSSVTVNIAHPLIRRRKMALWGNVGLEGRDIEEEQLNSPTFEDSLRILYGALNFRDDRANGVTTLSGRVSAGLNMLGASVGGGSLSRPDADGEFTKFNLYLSRYQNIGKTFGVYAAFAGQASLNPLLASEEFAIGGANFGRAYDYGELVGDDGLATLVELRYGRSPNIGLLDFYQLYGFYDYGVVWNDNATPGFDSLSMASAGAGLRLRFPHAVSATFEIARPLDRTPFTQNDRDWRGFFSVSKSF